MERARLEVRLTGPAAEGGRVRVDTLIEISQAVQTAVTRLAYGLRGEATVRRGRAPKEIADLTRLEIIGLREGSAVLVFGLAERERPIGDLDLGIEALQAFESGVISVAAGGRPPEPWDEGVLRAVAQMTRALERGIDEIVVGRPAAPAEQLAVFKQSIRDEGQLASPTGQREQLEIEGRLLMADFAAIRHEARIHRPLDTPVRCLFEQRLESTVLRLLRRYVRATGWATFDSQGRIQSLELDSLADAELSAGRAFWDLATLDELAEEQGIEPVERLEDLVSGFWPEDESVDEFLAAIESRD